jgi:hypothetical protein
VDHAVTLPEKVVALLGTWSRPPDLPAKAALAVAAFMALHALGRGHLLTGSGSFAPPLDPEQQARADGERRRFLATAALAAALLSVAYVSSYLKGGPRIIDATTYFLQARAMSEGALAWPTLEPSASFRGRFLLQHDGPDGPTLGGIFPPGYPLVLAIGFWLGAPMIVGPLIGAALVVATYRLARALAERTAPELAEPIARAAALLSVLCAALRYHTADTMSHGAAALGITTALVCSMRRKGPDFRIHGRSGLALLAGLCVGWVFSTRPVSALPIAIVTAWLLRRDRRRLALAALGLLPGIGLLLASQRAVTGSWLRSTQRVYYAISDGPPGCFRWGFGEGTGCVFEHGDFVHARLEHGYGVVEALGTTLRRLWLHLLDVANLEPLALLVLVAAVSALRPRDAAAQGDAGPLRAALAVVGLQVLAYVPFYFDGNYPGGGARFFADVLPIEHALVMIGVARLVRRRPPASGGEVRFTRAAFVVLSLAGVGFSVHASYEHGKLRDRDGGRPMFEPDVLARASVSKGLVFVDTDHGFALGHDPKATPSTGILVARLRDDDRDRMLFEALDRPPTWLYRLEPNAAEGGAVAAKLTPWAPPEHGKSLRFEAEAEWPSLSQQGGLAVPAWVDACASRSRALVLVPSPADGNAARATIELPVPSKGRWSVEVHVVHGATVSHAKTRTDPGAKGAVRIGDETWTWAADQPATSACASAGAKELDLVPPRAIVTIEASGGPVAVDHFSLKKVR